VKLDYDRLRKYLDEIAAETMDIESLLQEYKEHIDVAKDTTALKSLKYSTIVIAEAIAAVLQHILAKKHNVVPEFCTKISAMNTLLQFYIFVAAFHD